MVGSIYMGRDVKETWMRPGTVPVRLKLEGRGPLGVLGHPMGDFGSPTDALGGPTDALGGAN